MIITKKDLDKMSRCNCGHPNCQQTLNSGFYFHAKCHPQADMQVFYKNGNLTITCGICKALVAIVVIESMVQMK